MFVEPISRRRPAAVEASRSTGSSSSSTPVVHIDIDADSDETDDVEEFDDDDDDDDGREEEETKAERVGDAAGVEGKEEADDDDEEEPKIVMVASSSTSAPTSSFSNAAQTSPYYATATTPRTRLDAAMAFNENRRRSIVGEAEKARNGEFFAAIRADLLQKTPPKASLKRPLAFQEQRSSRAPSRDDSNSVRAGGPHELHSSSDSSGVEDEDERKESKQHCDEPMSPLLLGTKRMKQNGGLDFFMRQPHQAFPSDLRSPEQYPHQQNRVCASRTRICGQRYGRCELVFSDRSVELLLWRQGETERRLWRGKLKYAHLQRFWYVRFVHLPHGRIH